ncbi:hypothetical protein J2S03_001540 [Alicyclobacillus cycloheptanicus]|uniref:DUF4160 domain-containing protein n=1 Tax=Alicyclobacillus cycloheptanicus TaxID=1457 RepID=A0ABT9XIT4_9BACL|nr:hypothetical protein [Alicyclobacillus cycloheptanicus]
MRGILLSLLIVRTHPVHPHFMFDPSIDKRLPMYYGLC